MCAIIISYKVFKLEKSSISLERERKLVGAVLALLDHITLEEVGIV